MMLDSRLCPLPPPPPTFGMSLLGEQRLMDRALVPAAAGLSPLHGGTGGGGYGGGTLAPRLWRPTLWGSPPPCPPAPPTLPLCPEPCHLSAPLAGLGVTHLYDYLASARLWYPWYYKGESLYGSAGSLDSVYDVRPRSPGGTAGGKDLPSRTLKAERLKERQELGHVLHVDGEHAAALSAARKAITATASTQTQFSSFNGDVSSAPPPPGYPGPPPAYFAPRGDPPPHGDYSVTHHPLYVPLPPPPPPPPPHPSHRPPSPSHQLAAKRLVELGGHDVQHAPLNLSLSSGGTPGSGAGSSSSTSSRQLPRPSVITCMLTSSSSSSSASSTTSLSSPMVVVSSSTGSGSSCSPRGQNGLGHGGSPRSSSPPALSDPAIEEHFRRSLGKSYRDSSLSSASSPGSQSVQSNVSITGCVDDHFAKALGDSTWKAIKSQRDNSSSDTFTSSVDDHFAKALGANTWRRIKAESEQSENSASGSSLVKLNSSVASIGSGCWTSAGGTEGTRSLASLGNGSHGLHTSSSGGGGEAHSPSIAARHASPSPAHSAASLGAPLAT